MFCEELTDINEECKGNAGGLKKVGTQNMDYVTITYGLDGEVSSVVTTKRFRRIPMKTGRGNYADTSTIDRGTGVSANTATLTVIVPHRRKEVLKSIKRMAAGQQDLAVVFQDKNERCWLMVDAYLATKDGASGGALTEANGETITLVSEESLTKSGLEITVEQFNALFDLTEPEIEEVNPTSGGSGSNVNIIGSGFADATSVRFGTEEAVFSVINDGLINAVVPTLTAGAVDIIVTSPDGEGGGATFTVV